MLYSQLPLGIFDLAKDVGNVSIPGKTEYDSQKQTFTLSGSGANMWFADDQFQFAYKQIKGDFILQADVEFIGEGTDPHRKAGWIVRNSLNPGAPHVNIAIHGDGLTSLQYRKKRAAETLEKRFALTNARTLQLERRGNVFIASAAIPGEPFQQIELADSALNEQIFAGIYVCSHNNDVTEKAVFRNVRIIIPAKKDFIPYQDYIGSHLEIMDIKSGHRTIMHSVRNSLQAPNWTADGKYLIYNRDGLLYTFNIKTSDIEVLETGFANRNNNDHVLSFDGKHMGISNHSKIRDDKSLIYIVPLEGGDPAQVTAFGPSYLHGWSPDGKDMVFTGGRNGQYDIYKIDTAGKMETQLTNTPGLDDGAEYTPDGKHIYFNSNRSGTMQIWRMKPDGSEQEQITFDEYNNWFPHISPDGKWIVFLSYMKDVPSGDHPFYKNVYLRLMPVDGGQPKVIAYVYGGQGTINVPSWSPDSKKIAFVSNSKID
ncbi:MAG: PD40 domain-containing protein [Calditrichae bacterium]|nr:PD40 domain-containing protein [Calditrichia bacterium]